MNFDISSKSTLIKIPLIPVGCYNLYTIYNIFWGNWGMEFHKKKKWQMGFGDCQGRFLTHAVPKISLFKGNWGIYFPPWPVAASAAAVCIFTHVRNSHIIGDHGEWPNLALAWAAFHLKKIIWLNWFCMVFSHFSTRKSLPKTD